MLCWSYILRNDCSDYAHKNGDTRLVNVGYLLFLDDMRCEDVDHEDKNENQSFNVKSLSTHLIIQDYKYQNIGINYIVTSIPFLLLYSKNQNILK